MRRIFIAFLVASLLTGCGKEEKKTPFGESVTYEAEVNNPVAKGEELFNNKGMCFSCHKPDQKIIAPSIESIAKIYKEQNADMVEFLKGNGQPIVDPSQYEVMKTNFAITKNMSDEELKALEAYMYSFLK